jgi:zinc D-Ala-D-Ala carboxypeptidase
MTERLSPHFTLEELTRSATAVRKGIRNVPGPGEIAALKLLCEKVLEPVREHFGKPVIVTSGYRSPRLNTAIGGSASSQHCKGEAADFTVYGVSNFEVCDWIHRKLNYDQLIYEFGEAGWVHCSYSAHRMRNAELTATRRGGRTVYLQGIVR